MYQLNYNKKELGIFMIKMRPYQQKAIDDLRDSYRNNLRVLLVMPTGSGKTCVFSQIAASAIEKNKTVLILSNRTEIFTQTIKAISHHDIPVCKIDPDNKRIVHGAKLFVGMVETFKRRIAQFTDVKFDLIIVDEAHNAAFNKVFESFPDTKSLGCTATPIGKSLYKYYSALIQSTDISDLIEQNFLCRCVGYEMQDDFSDLARDKSGEFTDTSLMGHFNKSKIYEGVIAQYQIKTPGKKAICFNCNIEHAIATTKAFNAAGIKSFCITSNTPDDERVWILKEFKNGAFPVLNNANILVAGFDEPSVEVIIMNRATTSLIMWLQACGRGSRIHPNKTHFTVIDFGGNFTRHGLWNEPRNWTLEPPRKKKTSGVAPVKSCKQCGAMLPATSKSCEFCGFVFEPTAAELAQGKLVEVTNSIRITMPGKYYSQCTIPELIELEKTGIIKATYVWRILRSRGALAVGEYARIKQYRDAWIIRQIEAIEMETADGHKIEFVDKKINEISLLTL